MPYLALCPKKPPSAGAPWLLLPTNFPPCEIVDQQTQRWLEAGAFATMIHDLRLLWGAAAGRKARPMATSTAAHSSPAPRAGIVPARTLFEDAYGTLRHRSLSRARSACRGLAHGARLWSI